MDIRTQYPTRFITAADLNGKSFTLTIKSVTLEEMQTHDNQKTTKPCLWFEGAQRGMVLNKTNSMIIANLYSYETDAWIGKRVTIHAARVKAFGSWQEAIRVREEVPSPAGGQPKPAAKAAQIEESAGLDDVEDVTDFDGTDSLDITIDPDTGEIIAPAASPNGAGSPLGHGGDDSADKSLWEPNAPVTSKPGAHWARLSPAQMTKLHTLGASVHGKRWEAERPALVSEVSDGACTSAKELTPEQATVLITLLETELRRARNGKVTA